MNKREIKFRVWEPLNKNMQYLNFALYENKGQVNHWVLPLDHQCCSDKNYTIMNLNNVEIMQYIGLKDKDGIEIYEGDILINTNKSKLNLGMDNQKYLVVYKTLGFNLKPLFKGMALKFDYDDLKKIGNIYENPELLNEEEACLMNN
ncbi:hypothetical protein G6Z34_13985 [Clostridium perfringens]|uniref:YopX protein domain-containing protein n=1 Tax=Clostridium perfringens TaxID=1502 RepID=A0AAP6WP43_CLOPF|nr:YopX family protein [Clostridium perfringens]NGU31195.1 hypothetical protein [Clostridium perfringens]